MAARSHQNLVWERTRHVLRLRSALREFYPAALQAFPELDAPDALELLGKAPDPDAGARLARRTLAAAYARANRRDPAGRAEKALRGLRADELRQPGPIQAALAAITSSEVAIIAALNTQIEAKCSGGSANAPFVLRRPVTDGELDLFDTNGRMLANQLE